MGLGGVAIAILPSIICLKLTFSDGLGGQIDVSRFNRTFMELKLGKGNKERILPFGLIVPLWN